MEELALGSNFTFDNKTLTGGILKLKLYNDYGSSSHSRGGDYFLTTSKFKLQSSVEENGQGGVLRANQITAEVFDRGGYFLSTIFNRAQMTNAQLKALLNVGGTDYELLYGDVDLSSILYSTIYDDGVGNETHNVTFTALSFLKRLELIPMITTGSTTGFRETLDSYKSLITYSRNDEDTAAVYNFPNTAGNNPGVGTVDWENTGTVFADDGIYSTADLTTGQITHYLHCTGFGFSLRSDAVILGIKIMIKQHASAGSTISDYGLKMVKGGSVVGMAYTNGGAWPTSDQYAVYAITVSDVGWTAADINSSTFGVAFAAQASGNATAYVDVIEIQVTYGFQMYMVKIIDILTCAQSMVGLSTDTPVVTSTIVARYLKPFDAHLDAALTDCYLPYKTSGGAFQLFWDNSTSGSFASMPSVKDFLTAFCQNFLLIPDIRYDPASDKIRIYATQRGRGTAVTTANLGIVTKSTLGTFFGYDAIKVVDWYDNSKVDYQFRGFSTFYTSAEYAFQLKARNFSATSYVNLISDPNNELFGLYFAGSAGYVVAQNVYDSKIGALVGQSRRNCWRDFLSLMMSRYWFDVQMYVREYSTTAIGVANLADTITINSQVYTVIGIERDPVQSSAILTVALYP